MKPSCASRKCPPPTAYDRSCAESGENFPFPNVQRLARQWNHGAMGAHGMEAQNDSGCQSGPGQVASTRSREPTRRVREGAGPSSWMRLRTRMPDEEDFKSVNIHVDDSYDRLNSVGEVKQAGCSCSRGPQTPHGRLRTSP